MRRSFSRAVAILYIVGTTTLFAQYWPASRSNYNPFWVNLGFGVGGINVTGALSGYVGFTYLTGERTISFRIAGCGGVDSIGAGDIGLMYGWSRSGERRFMSYGIGIGYVRTNEFAGNDETVGIPLEIQLFYRPAGFLGLGIYGFANVNLKKLFYGACLCLQVGLW